MERLPQTIYLKPEVKKQLRYVSYKTEKSQSKITNEALENYLEEEVKRFESLEK